MTLAPKRAIAAAFLALVALKAMMGFFLKEKSYQPDSRVYWIADGIKSDLRLTWLEKFLTSNLQMACDNNPSADKPPAITPCLEIVSALLSHGVIIRLAP